MNRMHRKKLSVAVMNAVNAGVVVGLAAPLAYAQQTPPTEPQRIERIEVTGSRIPSPTLTSESPVNVISAQDIAYTGLTSTSDILNQLPQASPGQGSNISNGSTGTSTIDLRGLGPNRTLVLIDGKRVPAGSPLQGGWATNINAIPSTLISRIEVLSGGASSIYGSDAIAGVVNFIMNDRFEGVQVDWQYSGYNHQQNSWMSDLVAQKEATNPAQFHVPGDVGFDGRTQNVSITAGSNFANNKGNATIFFSWQQQDAVLQGTRDYSACSLVGQKAGAVGTKSNPIVNGYACGGSSTSYPGRFTDFSNFDLTIKNAAGDVRNYVGSQDQYNFAPVNYWQRPDTRYLFNAFMHYDVLPQVRTYAEFDYMNDRTVAQIAPSGAFLQPFTLSNDNPLLSQSFKDAVGLSATNPTSTFYIGRRNIEGGGRQDDFTLNNFRVVLGAKGSVLDDKWDYNAWWQSGRNTLGRTYLNDFSVARLNKAFNVVPDTRPNAPVPGGPVCASVVDGTDTLCVPYDIFHIGGVTQAALNYLQTPGFMTGYTAQSVVGLQVNSDLGSSYGWTLPWAKDGIGFAAGIERRVEKLTNNVDAEFATGDLAGQGGATVAVSGQFTVLEPYAEVRVPIAQRQPWAYDLTFTGAYRYSNYSTNKTTNSYGLGADWSVIREAKVRGSYQQAVRAANVIELFLGQGYNLFDGTDPCAGPTPTATLAQCARSGVTAAQYGKIPASPAGQYNTLQGGNPALDPETAKTYTLGGVLQFPRFSATLDYWHYKVDQVIGTVIPQQALNNCVNTGVNCDLIFRGANGNLWLPNSGYVLGLNQNLGSYLTDGIDITANYTQPLDSYGSLQFSLLGTWINQFVVTPIPGLGSYDCVGLYGPSCGVPVPAWKSKLMAVWNTPWDVNVALAWRYIDGVDVTFSSSNPLLNGAYAPSDRSIGAQNYFDLSVQWNATKNFTFRAGVNNILDRDPPNVSSTAGTYPSIAGPSVFGNGNTFPQVYDTLGRFIYFNVTGKF